MGEPDRPPCSSATGPAGCGGGAALRVARHGAAWLFKRDLPPGSRSSPPPFRLLRTCSLSGGRRGSSPARWGSLPPDGREGGREPVLSGCGPGPATATATAPRPGLSLYSASAAPPPALRRGPGARPDGGGGGRRRGCGPAQVHTRCPPGLQDQSSRGRSATPGILSPVKSQELRCQRSARCG